MRPLRWEIAVAAGGEKRDVPLDTITNLLSRFPHPASHFSLASKHPTHELR